MKQQPLLLTDIPEQKGISVYKTSHQGEKMPGQQERGLSCSAASRFMQPSEKQPLPLSALRWHSSPRQQLGSLFLQGT